MRRIEKALGRVGGVEQANVNLATEKATVAYDPSVATPAQMQAAVEKAGYGVRELAIPTTAPSPSHAPSVANGEVTLPIEGMTCASCVRRIEKALNKVECVQEATVNLATEKAHVVFDPAQTSVDQMRAAVDKAGYKVAEVSPPSASAVPAVDAGVATDDPHDVERQREN